MASMQMNVALAQPTFPILRYSGTAWTAPLIIHYTPGTQSSQRK